MPEHSLLMPPKPEGHDWIGLDESMLILYIELDVGSYGLVTGHFELSLFYLASGRGLKRVIGPEVFGVAALQFFSHLRVTGFPKTCEVLGDLNGASGRREQMNENRDPPVDQAGRVALSE